MSQTFQLFTGWKWTWHLVTCSLSKTKWILMNIFFWSDCWAKGRVSKPSTWKVLFSMTRCPAKDDVSTDDRVFPIEIVLFTSLFLSHPIIASSLWISSESSLLLLSDLICHQNSLLSTILSCNGFSATNCPHFPVGQSECSSAVLTLPTPDWPPPVYNLLSRLELCIEYSSLWVTLLRGVKKDPQITVFR